MFDGNPNTTPNERIAILDTINPASRAAGTVSTGWLAAKDFAQFEALLSIGAMTATGTFDAKIEQATDSAGAGVKDITGKAIVQLLAAAGSNKEHRISFRQDDLDSNNNFTHFRLTCTVAVAASIYQAQVQGHFPRYGQASLFNDASVTQVV